MLRIKHTTMINVQTKEIVHLKEIESDHEKTINSMKLKWMGLNLELTKSF